MAEDWTAYAASYIADAMQSFNSVPVEIRDSSGTLLLTGIRATFLPFRQTVNHGNADGPIGVEIDQTSFVFRASDVVFEMRLGYSITATINEVQTEWLVVNGLADTPASFFDKHKQQIQVMVEEQ